ncbi:MAG: hypothetical protein KGI91_09110 [Burkholderiales bacterium]|nr:hypothetical protein [Burkholderiales bacterium]MDE2077216.1 hypothetical protein [Burkholderiales bacterium]MDE2433753.1 hypothetical protein [Burkholderiales bacterium]
MNRLIGWVLAAVALWAPSAWAQNAQSAQDEQPAVKQGNQELPKILYIVPWKKALPGEVNGRPQLSLLNEPLQPLDPESFHREIQYQSQVKAQRQARGQAAAQP